MARKIFIDRRFTPNGKKGRIEMDNTLELQPYIDEVIAEYNHDTIIGDYLTANPVTVNQYNVDVYNDSTVLTAADQYVQVSGTSDVATITLPDATTVAGLEFVVQVNDITGDVTIDTDGGNINGAPSVVLTAQYDFVRVISNGTNYFVIGSLITP